KTVVDDVPEEELAAAEAETEQHVAPQIDENGEEIKRFNPKTDIQLKDAQAIKKTYAIGDEIKTPLEIPGDFGRMAAQTAKQVIIQKLRETEREAMYEEFKDKEGEILVGTVQRREGPVVLVDLGRLTAIMPPEEQIRAENYTPGMHVKVFVVSVRSTTKGPEIVVSRAHVEIIRKLFNLEIPEIASGVVQIKSIAREAGSRTKISVWTDEENIDPIGSCIGQRGARIQTIISELKGEKVDVIKYSEDIREYISNALSPAKIVQIDTDENAKTATATVAGDQLSLAIGKAGQNVRLAARLTGWKIDIVSNEGEKVDVEAVAQEEGDGAVSEEVPAETEKPAESTEAPAEENKE
ncbi:MAG: transcription termination/antitermination protein NusA, partial [Candidatus Buchananbacteria bacterium]|nr:transcription termination/antitermination protein NusA [Candidatus Buchananbacteria bacterium]